MKLVFSYNMSSQYEVQQTFSACGLEGTSDHAQSSLPLPLLLALLPPPPPHPHHHHYHHHYLGSHIRRDILVKRSISEEFEVTILQMSVNNEGESSLIREQS